MALNDAHVKVERIAREVGRLRDRAEGGSLPKSRWRSELSSARRSRAGTAAERGRLLDDVHEETRFYLTILALRVDGIADLLHAAALRPKPEVVVPALGDVVRGLIESSAVVFWLMDRSASAEDRMRRYLRWIIDDMRSEQAVWTSAEFANDHPVVREIEASAPQREEELAGRIERAGWALKRSEVDSSGRYKQPYLLRSDGRPGADGFPSLTDLSKNLLGGPSGYRLLSAGSHSHRHGVRASSELKSLDDGTSEIHVTGLGTTALWVNLGLVGLMKATQEFADAVGADSTALDHRVSNLRRRMTIQQKQP